VPRALAIDDESTIRAALSRFFRRRGWICHEADMDAPHWISWRSPAPTTCSSATFGCRVMSEVELHDHLAASSPELLDRLLLIAGDVTSPEVAEFLERTSCPLLTKPFELHELASAVEELQGRARQV
jgi:DNA-binding NtrC family response regulator